MNSFFARNRLSAYLDHSLPRDEAEAVAEAVARDIALSADLRAMKKALTLLQERGRVPAPTGFQARTMAAVAQQPVPGSQVAWIQRRLRRIPTELVAVVGAAVIVLIGLSGRDDPAQSSPPPSPAVSVSSHPKVAAPGLSAEPSTAIPATTDEPQPAPEEAKTTPSPGPTAPKATSKNTPPPSILTKPWAFGFCTGVTRSSMASPRSRTGETGASSKSSTESSSRPTPSMK